MQNSHMKAHISFHLLTVYIQLFWVVLATLFWTIYLQPYIFNRLSWTFFDTFSLNDSAWLTLWRNSKSNMVELIRLRNICFNLYLLDFRNGIPMKTSSQTPISWLLIYRSWRQWMRHRPKPRRLRYRLPSPWWPSSALARSIVSEMAMTNVWLQATGWTSPLPVGRTT